jgi:formylglycine-generating enzyme required for sulfatase activity
MKTMFPDSPYLTDVEKYLDEYREIGPLPGLSFVPIVQGTFVMGSPESEEDRDKDEGPQRKVHINSFYISETEITQRQWKEVMDKNPSKFEDDDHPVEKVSWTKAKEFIAKLNQMDPGKNYRLPTEAEWEYACKGGSNFDYPIGNEENYLDEVAWYKGNSGKTTHPVGMKPANPFGLKDMIGNVAEWVEDPYHSNYIGAPNDGGIWLETNTKKRVVRGGAFNSKPSECRSADRTWNYKDSRYSNVGFRIIRNP